MARTLQAVALGEVLTPASRERLQVWMLGCRTGDQRLRAHDVFTSICIPDLFMERVKADGAWSLFDPKEVPELVDLPAGCPFAGRCARTIDACAHTRPPPVPLGPDHVARCLRLEPTA